MADKLKTYRDKRDFQRTSEPAGSVGSGGNRFVIHKHHATADHYDLRLELDGVLKSWAVPKGPSLNPADKRFAAATEDHPIDYIDFEGVIPEGEYGGGPMIVWDTGTWAPMGDPHEDLKKGAFKFRLVGEKLRGGWMLARLKGRPGDKGKEGWILFKERDTFMNTEADILEDRPESVKTGRRIEELVAAPASFAGDVAPAFGAPAFGAAFFARRSAASSSSIVSPDFTLSGRAATMSVAVSTPVSFSLTNSQLFLLSPALAFMRISTQPPLSFSPHSRNLKSPLASPSCGSFIGTKVPVSHTIIGPPPYSPSGITASKSIYSSGWSSVWAA
jgi:DNA ligase D-like protein (predicted 3'-phosphoesterase)